MRVRWMIFKACIDKLPFRWWWWEHCPCWWLGQETCEEPHGLHGVPQDTEVIVKCIWSLVILVWTGYWQDPDPNKIKCLIFVWIYPFYPDISTIRGLTIDCLENVGVFMNMWIHEYRYLKYSFQMLFILCRIYPPPSPFGNFQKIHPFWRKEASLV